MLGLSMGNSNKIKVTTIAVDRRWPKTFIQWLTCEQTMTTEVL